MSSADGWHEHTPEDAWQGNQSVPLLDIRLGIFPSLPLDSVVWYSVYTFSERRDTDGNPLDWTDLTATRQKSLELLEQLTDEQLAQPVPGAPWADGTIGGVLITNAYHAERHASWAEEGLRQQA